MWMRFINQRESLCHSLAPTLASPARKTYRRQGRRQIWLNQRHLGNLTLSAKDARRSHNHPQPVQHQPAGFDEGRLDLDALAGLDRIDVERYYSPNLFSLLLLGVVGSWMRKIEVVASVPISF